MAVNGPQLDNPIDVFELLNTGLNAKPNDTVLVSGEDSWTWKQLHETSDRLATNMLGLGLKPGDRVASLMPNVTAYVVHFVACIKAGFVATPLNYRYMAPEIDHALDVSGASVLLAHTERDADVAQSRLAGQLPFGVLRYGAHDEKQQSFEGLMERASPPVELYKAKQSDPAFIFFTSGSTGLPKGVTHTFETIGWIAASTIAALNYTPNDVFLTASSLSHEGGVGFSFAGLSAGMRIVVPRNTDGDEVLPLLRQERPTVVWTLPALLIGLVRDHGAKREDFKSLRLCMTGGDKASAELEREFEELTDFPIHESYGMTEIGCATVNPPSGVNKPGSIGTLAPGYAGSIRDENGTELSTGEEGRLWIKSPTNMIGYWNNEEATKATISDGWIDTGDVMRFDSDGYLWFCGRKKQIIVHDGSNISPQEVEGALMEHPAVEAAGVVGVHNLVHGENVCAYITLKADADQPTSQQLIRFVRERVGYKAPEEIIVLDQMPLSPAGKTDRVALKRMAAEKHGSTVASDSQARP